MLGGDVNIDIFSGKPHRKPDLFLAAKPPTPHLSGDLDRQVVAVQDPALADDLGLVGADFFAQLAQSRLARRLAGVDPALRHLPGGQPRRHVDAAAGKDAAVAVDQDDADPGTVFGERIVGGRNAQFTTRPLNSAIPRSMSTARTS